MDTITALQAVLKIMKTRFIFPLSEIIHLPNFFMEGMMTLFLTNGQKIITKILKLIQILKQIFLFRMTGMPGYKILRNFVSIGFKNTTKLSY